MTYLGENIGKLGFGLMRLPKKGEKTDVEQTSKMVDLFMEAGFTYFDTAWAYAVSYTHLDVYKRQLLIRLIHFP